MSTHFMFATGIENSAPTIGENRLRVDEMLKCGHYDRWRDDFDLVEEVGTPFLRYGPPLHRAHLGPGRYDWSFADETYGEIRRRGISPRPRQGHPRRSPAGAGGPRPCSPGPPAGGAEARARGAGARSG